MFDVRSLGTRDVEPEPESLVEVVEPDPPEVEESVSESPVEPEQAANEHARKIAKTNVRKKFMMPPVINFFVRLTGTG